MGPIYISGWMGFRFVVRHKRAKSQPTHDGIRSARMLNALEKKLKQSHRILKWHKKALSARTHHKFAASHGNEVI